MNTTYDKEADPVLSREDALAILNTPDDQLQELIDRASALRHKYKGNRVSIHILTNARSGNCSQDCAYCAQSCRSKADIDKYKWVDEDKLYHNNDFVNEHHLSRHCIGLSGMKFTDQEIEELARRIRKMKENGTHLCCSIGFLTEKQAKMLKDAGLDRINHNLNSSRSFYHNICTTHTFERWYCGYGRKQGRYRGYASGAAGDPAGSTSDQLPAADQGHSAWRCRHLRTDHRILSEGTLPCQTSGSKDRYPLRCRKRSLF